MLRSKPTNISAAPARLPSTRLLGGAAAYYIGEESINQAAANAESGSTIEVLKGDVKLDITADDVTVKNSGDGDVTVNDQDVPAGDEGVVTHTHKAEKKRGQGSHLH